MGITGWIVVFGLVGGLAGAGARIVAGRVRRGARVGPPGCEVVVAAAWAVAGGAWAAGSLAPRWLPALLGLAWLGAALGAVDLSRARLPDALTLPALPGALLLVAPLGAGAVLRGLAGALVGVGAHAAVRRWAPDAVGGGDVKLAGPLGAILGAASWAALAVAAVLAALFTAGAAAVGVVTRRLPRGHALPHGPSMLLAAWLVTFGAAW